MCFISVCCVAFADRGLALLVSFFGACSGGAEARSYISDSTPVSTETPPARFPEEIWRECGQRFTELFVSVRPSSDITRRRPEKSCNSFE